MKNNKPQKLLAGIMAICVLSGLSLASIPVSAANDLYSSSVSFDNPVLNTNNMILTRGYKFNLVLINGKTTPAFWSENSEIASVNTSGEVVGNKNGVTRIFASDGQTTYTCKVEVVETKISLSSSAVNMDENNSASVLVNVKGSKKLTATVIDKSIATVAWGTKWNDNSIALKINAEKKGRTQIKIYNPDYPSKVSIINVNVTGENVLTSNISNLTAYSGTTKSFYVQSDVAALNMDSTDSSIAKPYVTKTSKGFCVTVKCYRPGTAIITLASKENPSNSLSIPVTVTEGIIYSPFAQYYVEKTYELTNPESIRIEARCSSDKIVYWVDEHTSQLRYMIVPYSYIPNNSNVYCIGVNDSEFSLIYQNYPMYWGTQPSGYYAIKNWDILHPQNNIVSMSPSDKLAWNITSRRIIQYMIIPGLSNLEITNFPYILNSDGTSGLVLSSYYKVVSSIPRKLRQNDEILTWIDNKGQTAFMLVPQNYDELKAASIKATSRNYFDYYTTYSSKPLKNNPSDIIISYWNSEFNETHFILVPVNYDEGIVENLKKNDLNRTNPEESLYDVSVVIDDINQKRTQSGISLLSTDVKLNKAVEIRTEEMKNKISHKRPDGSSYISALTEANVDFNSCKEIIIKDADSAYDVISCLLSDSEYRDIILSSLNKNIAVGYEQSKNVFVLLITD